MIPKYLSIIYCNLEMTCFLGYSNLELNNESMDQEETKKYNSSLELNNESVDQEETK